MTLNKNKPNESRPQAMVPGLQVNVDHDNILMNLIQLY
jgi:hypothetical protein